MVSAIILVLLMLSAVSQYSQAEGHEVKCVLVTSQAQPVQSNPAPRSGPSARSASTTDKLMYPQRLAHSVDYDLVQEVYEAISNAEPDQLLGILFKYRPFFDSIKRLKGCHNPTRDPKDTWQACASQEDCNKIRCIYRIPSWCSRISGRCQCPNARIAKQWCSSTEDCQAYCRIIEDQPASANASAMACKDHTCRCLHH